MFRLTWAGVLFLVGLLSLVSQESTDRSMLALHHRESRPNAPTNHSSNARIHQPMHPPIIPAMHASTSQCTHQSTARASSLPNTEPTPRSNPRWKHTTWRTCTAAFSVAASPQPLSPPPTPGFAGATRATTPYNHQAMPQLRETNHYEK